MISILIKADSAYQVNRKKLSQVAGRFLKKHKVKGNTQVSLAIIGNRRMRQLNRQYRQIDKATSVLAFPLGGESKFTKPPDGVLRLGDIVIAYPVAKKQAEEEGLLTDQKIARLVEHGLGHLLKI